MSGALYLGGVMTVNHATLTSNKKMPSKALRFILCQLV